MDLHAVDFVGPEHEISTLPLKADPAFAWQVVAPS
jgi:hypothetical protein